MPNLPTGPYRLEVSLQAFRTYEQTGIVLQVAATPTINAVLGVGSLEETLGDHVRSSIEGPAFWTIDLALARNISITGTQSVELRLETFNLLNHFNWGNPTVNLDAANFGRIQSQTGSPRILQFGVKYGF